MSNIHTKGSKGRFAELTKIHKTRRERSKPHPSIRQLVREALKPKKEDTK